MTPQELPQPQWKARVAELDHKMAGMDLSRVGLLFLGDSITQGWLPLVFDQFYKTRDPLNLAVLGDSTNGLLWRLARLPLGTRLRPRIVVLLIGTNNLWPGVNPADVADGVGEVVDQIRRRSPTSRVLLVGLLPRGASPEDPLRLRLQEVNARLARCADGTVTYADPGSMLVDGEGHLSSDMAYDYLHPTWLGYAILSAALEPYLRQMLHD